MEDHSIACLTLTVNSLYSARGYYGVLENEIILIPETESDNIMDVSPETDFISNMPSEYSIATQHFSIQAITVMVAAIALSLAATYFLTGRLLIPLTTLQVLEMDEEPEQEDYKEFTAAAKVSIDRLTETVDALMTLAGGNGGGYTEITAVRSLFELAVSEQNARAEAASITISIAGTCPDTCVDRTLLYRVIFNLLENAVKYNRPGGTVAVSLSSSGCHSILCIEDNGIGMSEEAPAHVFEPFYRADKSRSQIIPGSGLGLSVVKTIVERLQGEIFLESREGIGTKVTVKF